MGIEKEPLNNQKEFDRILAVATRDSNPDARKVILLLRYSGMHISVLYKEKYALDEIGDKEGDIFITWNRPKKVGKESYTLILKSQYIDFDVGEFAGEVRKRTRRKSRQYFYLLIKRIGEEAGFPGLCQMTFRHSLGVDMAERGVSRDIIQHVLNCSDKVLKTYMKHSKAQTKEILKSVGW